MASLALGASILVAAYMCVCGDDPLLFAGMAHEQIKASMTQRLREAISRPLMGVAVAVFIFLCAEGHAPRLAALLAKPACRVLAGLSYSMYLMQFGAGLIRGTLRKSHRRIA